MSNFRIVKGNLLLNRVPHSLGVAGPSAFIVVGPFQSLQGSKLYVSQLWPSGPRQDCMPQSKGGNGLKTLSIHQLVSLRWLWFLGHLLHHLGEVMAVRVQANVSGDEARQGEVEIRLGFMILLVRTLRRLMRLSRVLFPYVVLKLVPCLTMDSFIHMYLLLLPQFWV